MLLNKIGRLIGQGRLPWRVEKTGGIFKYFFRRPVEKLKVWFAFKNQRIQEEDDTVTVVFAVKNRSDHRITNALHSIRNQDYDQRLVRIIVVDYDSGTEQAAFLKSLCLQRDADYIRCENQPVWNKAHAINVAIRQVQSKFMLSADADVFFEPHYLSVAVKHLRRKPMQVILASFLDLPETAKRDVDIAHWKAVCKPRGSNTSGKGVNMTYTFFYRWIRGYDENYRGWGQEDTDIIIRFIALGLAVTDIGIEATYFHQWHPKHEGIGETYTETHMAQNKAYHKTAKSILRNPNGWGEWEGKVSI